MRLFMFLLEGVRSFQLLSKNLFRSKCLKVLTVLGKTLSFFCIDVVAMTKKFTHWRVIDQSIAIPTFGFCKTLKLDQKWNQSGLSRPNR